MKSNYLLLIPALLVLSACNITKPVDVTKTIEENPTSEPTSTVVSTSNESSQTTTSVDSTSQGTSTSKTSATSATQATTNTTQSTSLPTTQSSDDYLDGRLVLPIGNVQIDAPTNAPVQIKTSTSSADWLNYKFTDEFPNDDFTYIYGNSSSKGPTGHYASTNSAFYSYSSSDEKQYPGGLKITKAYQGFQTPLFEHSGAKLEIRLPISQVNNANGNPTKGKDLGYIYYYDKNANFLSGLTTTIEELSIESSTKELKYYVTGQGIEDVAYLEVRFNAQAYKGNQNYNVGIGGISIHSWTFA